MLLALALIFSVATIGMAVIPLRHVLRMQKAVVNGEETQIVENNSVARAYVQHLVDRVDVWIHWNAREESLKLVDRGLKILERAAGRFANQTKHIRLMVQERFRVTPRESPYWQQIRTWKKTGDTTKKKEVLHTEEHDISNHL